jgi:ribosomal protein L11 methylase PrmA
MQLLDQGLGELVLPDGWLILSGILAEQSAEVEHALQAHGFHLVDKRQSGDWVALAASR